MNLELLFVMWSKQQLVCDVDLPPDDRSLYYQILRKEYHSLLSSVKKYWFTKSKDQFSEDVFHDTLINCINSCCIMTNRDDIYRYVCKSYYMNMIRECSYSYHICDLTGDLDMYNITTTDSYFDTVKNEIFEYTEKDKGSIVSNMVQDYMNGYTIKEIMQKYSIKNVHKNSRLLKSYIEKVIKMHIVVQ